MQPWSTFEWNSLLRRSEPRRALFIFARSMLFSGAIPNKFTFTFLLKATTHCAGRILVPLLHAHIIKLSLHSDPFLTSSLISSYAHTHNHDNTVTTIHRLFTDCPSKDTTLHTAVVSAYGRFGLPDAARLAFDCIAAPNSISWAAFPRAGRHAVALSSFHCMRLEGVPVPTEAALISVLASTSALCDATPGLHAHRLIIVAMGRLTAALGTALLTMYKRCGLVEDAFRVFGEMPDKDQAAWTAMISALAAHSQGEEALGLFDGALAAGIVPDHVMYVGVLHACSHSCGGMVDKAKFHFEEMRRAHGIIPRAEHYGCMVDVLARGGNVEEAWELVRTMPFEPDEYVLKSLLAACCSYGFVEWAEWAAAKLRKIDAGHLSSYVMLSNAYAGHGRWEDSARVRRLMRDRGVPKTPGSSSAGCYGNC